MSVTRYSVVEQAKLISVINYNPKIDVKLSYYMNVFVIGCLIIYNVPHSIICFSLYLWCFSSHLVLGTQE